jgi:hypothetical protein
MDRPKFLDGDDWTSILRELIPSLQTRRAGALDTTDAYVGTTIEEVPSIGLVLAVSGDQDISLADSDIGIVCGVSLVQADNGAKCDYVARGYVFSESWAVSTGNVRLVAGRTYFLHGKGRLSLIPPTSGYIIPIGQAQSDFLMDVCIGTKIKL